MHNPFVGTLDRIWGGDHRSEGALTGRMRVADRSGELCPLPVPSCLPTGPAQELRHALWALPDTLQPPALTSQQSFGRWVGAQAGARHEAGWGEGRRGRRGQLLQAQSRVLEQRRQHRDPPAATVTVTNLPSRPPSPGELLHHQRGEDADAAVEVPRPEAVVHLVLGAGQHADDGTLGEAQLLGALPLVVVEGSHQPGCGEGAQHHGTRCHSPIPG